MGEEVDLSSQDLEDVPADILLSGQIKKLILDYNNISSLPLDLCQKLSALSYLSLNGNLLETLPDEIGLLEQLSELFLKENSLDSLPESLPNLGKLTKLHITGNQIRELPKAIHNLVSLSELKVDENEIIELPLEFGNLLCLTFLDLSYNSLQELPDSFGLLKSLKELDLSNNRLKTLPESFKDLPSLEVVDLTNNELKTIPSHSSSSRLLKKFLINNNSLTQLPDWLSESASLLELCVGANDLLDVPFPKGFGSSNCNIELLDLSGNNITSLPESFGYLFKLKYLDLGSSLDELERNRFIANGNNLKHLPESFTNLEHLIKLELDENELVELPISFGKLINLTYLDLSHNNLQTLPDSFSLLKNLKICMLSMNYLTELPSDFGLLTAIEDLKLDSNMLTELPESFKNMVSLVSLDLYKNKLIEVPKALSNLCKLKQLDLRENNFGLPLDEIPDIKFEPTYLSRKQELSGTWRGRKRHDISATAWVDSKDEKSGTKKVNDNIIYSALTSASSLYRKHGQSDVRQKSPKKATADNTETANTENDTMHNCVNGVDSDEGECWDEDIYEEISKNNQNSEPVNFDIDLKISDLDSDESNLSENDAKFIESDWESDSDFGYNIPSNFRKIFRHPVKDVEAELNLLIPSDLHVERVKVNEVWRPIEDGQFDDAEDC